MAPKATLKIHLIFVTKYRSPVLDTFKMNFVIESLTNELKKRKCEIIAIQGDDKNHIHIMFQYNTNKSVSWIVSLLKQRSSYDIWCKYPEQMRKHYWSGRHILWSKGYFYCSAGNASSETIRRYIEQQG